MYRNIHLTLRRQVRGLYLHSTCSFAEKENEKFQFGEKEGLHLRNSRRTKEKSIIYCRCFHFSNDFLDKKVMQSKRHFRSRFYVIYAYWHPDVFLWEVNMCQVSGFQVWYNLHFGREISFSPSDMLKHIFCKWRLCTFENITAGKYFKQKKSYAKK